MPRPSTQLRLYNLQNDCPLSTRKLGISLRSALSYLPASPIPLPAEIEINWISASEMSRVHEEFLQDPSLTDIITFDHGEILICPQVAQQEAARHGHTYEQELLFYALHGLLHLLGWNDQTPISRRKMHKEQLRIMIAIGALMKDTKK